MVHPECREAIEAEFKRLVTNNPTVSTVVCRDVAERFVRTVAMADTLSFLRSIEVDHEAH